MLDNKLVLYETVGPGKYIPTIPKIAVKIASSVLFTKLENGPTHPCFSAATRGVVQVASVTNGGEVLL